MQPEENHLSPFNGRAFQPLGIVRLRAVELLNQIIKVNQDVIFIKVLETNIMKYLMELCEQHVWNNLLHIKTFEIWDCIFKSGLTAQQKFDILKNSQAVDSTVNIGQQSNVRFLTERVTRNGNMAFAVKLANLFKA